MKKIVVALMAIIICGALIDECLADIVALDDKSFIVVQQIDSESERVSYYKVVNDAVRLHQMFVVNYSFDQRITRKSRDIYIKFDKPALEYLNKQ